MMRRRCVSTSDLFVSAEAGAPQVERLAEGALVLRGFAALDIPALIEGARSVAVEAPPRQMTTPGGHRMSTAMTNCGLAGWVADKNGYRYDSTNPDTGRPWPPMPAIFKAVAVKAAAACGYARFDPDVCLITRYGRGARLSLHRDENERDLSAPVVSVSIGLPATFLFGGLRRCDARRRVPVHGGDVAVWGGAVRLSYHGIEPLIGGEDALAGNCRINLSFRMAL